MGRKKSDARSVEQVRDVLQRLGCPLARRAEGGEEWKRLKGAFAATPDLVAGPLVGGGARADFMIDVFEPSGEPYEKLLAGNPEAADIFRRAIESRGAFTLGDLGESYDHFYGPITRKIERYSVSRGTSQMVGVAMYFACDQKRGGVALAHFDALRALDRAFGIDVHCGNGELMRTIDGVCSVGASAQILIVPISLPLSFLLYVADKESGQKVVLLVNDFVRSPSHPFAEHQVIHWLRCIAEDA